MQTIASPTAVGVRPRGLSGSIGPDSNAAEIEHWFQQYRESAVRLVEQITDLVGETEDPVGAARADLRIVRSIFGKWSADVLLALHAVPSIGFEELRRTLPGISPRVLSLKLKELEQSDMVQREILDSRPPRVRYSLTKRGWTVAWLSQPIFLYLRLTQRRPGPTAPAGRPIVAHPVPAKSDGPFDA